MRRAIKAATYAAARIRVANHKAGEVSAASVNSPAATTEQPAPSTVSGARGSEPCAVWCGVGNYRTCYFLLVN